MIKKIILFLLGTGTAFAAGTTTLEPMEYVLSQEIAAMQTADGDLDLDEYVVLGKDTIIPAKQLDHTAETLYLIRTVPKDEGQWTISKNPQDIVGKTEVQLACDGCLHYSLYRRKDGSFYRKIIPAQTYNKFRYEAGYKAEVENEVVLLGRARATPAFVAGGIVDNAGAATSISASVDIGTGPNFALIVVVGKNDYANAPTSVTYNAVGMALEDDAASSAADRGEWTYSLAAPATGSNTLTANFSGSTWAHAASASYSSVNQSNVIGAVGTSAELTGPNCDTGDGPNGSVTTTVLDSLVIGIGFVADDAVTLTPQSPLTDRQFNNDSNSGGSDIADQPALTIASYDSDFRPASDNQHCFSTSIELLASLGAGGSAGDNDIDIISE